MLVLSRKIEEEIVIAEGEIVIKVVGLRDGVVRLGITAPRDIPVMRREVHEAIQREKKRT